MVPVDDMIGAELKNRYKLTSLLGKGGMGTVYRAADSRLERDVAVKLMRLSSATSSKRFEREFQALAQIKSPLVPEIFTWGTTSAGEVFLIMELVQGRTLEDLLSNAQLSQAQLKEIFLQVCHGLATIHDSNMVHRDIKPANIMVHMEDDMFHVKIMDFGIVHLLGEEDRLTASNDIIGSHGYLSPEHLTPALISARSDIFSLGCTMFRAYEGRMPFEDTTPIVSLMRMKEGRFSALTRAVPPEVAATITKCLAKDPANRFSSVREVEESLVSPPLSLFRQPRVSVPDASKFKIAPAVLSLFLVATIVIALSVKQASTKAAQAPATLKVSFETELRTAIKPSSPTNAPGSTKPQAHQNQPDLDKVKELCTHFLAVRPQHLNSRQQSAVSTLCSIEDAATTSGDFGCLIKAIQVQQMADDLSKSSRSEDQRGTHRLGLLLRLDDSNRELLPELKKVADKILERSATVPRKRLHENLANLYARFNRLDWFAESMCKALSAEPTDDAERRTDLLLAAHYRTLHNDDLATCKKLLLSRVPVFQKLVANNTIDTDTAARYLEAVLSIPPDTRSLSQWKLLTESIQALRARPSLSPRDRALFEILEGALTYPRNQAQGRKTTLMGLNKALDLKLSDDIFHACACLVCSMMPMPANIVANLLQAPPESWREHNRLISLFANYVRNNDISASLHLYTTLKQRDSKPQITLGTALAILLSERSRNAEAASIVRDLQACPDWFKPDLVNALCHHYTVGSAKNELRQLWNYVKGKDERTAAFVAISLASLLTEPEEKDERMRLLAFPPINRYSQEPAFVEVLAKQYSKEMNVESLHRLADRVRRANMPEPDSMLSNAILAEFANASKDDKLTKDLLESVITSKHVSRPEVLQRLLSIYKRQANVNALGELQQQLQIMRAPQDSIDYAKSVQAAVLSLTDKAAAYPMARELLNSKRSHSETTIWNLAEAFARTEDAESLGKLLTLADIPPRMQLPIKIRLAPLLCRKGKSVQLDALCSDLRASEHWQESTDVINALATVYETTKDPGGLIALLKVSRQYHTCYNPPRIAFQLLALMNTLPRSPLEKEAIDLIESVAIETQNQELFLSLVSFLQQRHNIEAQLQLLAQLPRMEFKSDRQYDVFSGLICDAAARSRTDDMWRLLKAMGPLRFSRRLPAFAVVNYLATLADTTSLRKLLQEMTEDNRCITDNRVYTAAALAFVLERTGQRSEADNVLKIVTKVPNWVSIDSASTSHVLILYGLRKDTAGLRTILQCIEDKQSDLADLARYHLAKDLSQHGKVAEFNGLCKQLRKTALRSDDSTIRVAELYDDRTDTNALSELYLETKAAQSSVADQLGLRLARQLALCGKTAESKSVAAEVLRTFKNKNEPTVHKMIEAQTYRTLEDLPELQQLTLRLTAADNDLDLLCDIFAAELIAKQGNPKEAAKHFNTCLYNPKLANSAASLQRLGNNYANTRNLQALTRIRALADELAKTGQNVSLVTKLRVIQTLQFYKRTAEAERLLHTIDTGTLRYCGPMELSLLAEVYSNRTRTDTKEVETLFNMVSPHGPIAYCCSRVSIGMTLVSVLARSDKTRAIKILRALKDELSQYNTQDQRIVECDQRVEKLLASLCHQDTTR